jgi:hypothetical protein
MTQILACFDYGHGCDKMSLGRVPVLRAVLFCDGRDHSKDPQWDDFIQRVAPIKRVATKGRTRVVEERT